MREISNVELDLIVGGYGEDTGGNFDESAFEPRATLMEDGSYSLTVSEAEYSTHHDAAVADTWCIEAEYWGPNGTYIRVRCSDSSNAC